MAQFKIAHGQTKNLPTALEEGQVYVTYDNNGQNGKIFADVEIDGEITRVGLEGQRGPQGVSGVYVGSGDMPDGYNIQIDPEGDIGDTAIEIHNQDPAAHEDIREKIGRLTNEKVDKDSIFLGIASDGLMHIFINGDPVGSGVARGGGDDVFGYVDENNIVVLSGNLPSGGYTIKYEMIDGSLVDIGNLVLDNNTYYSVVNNLTNCSTNNNALQAVEGSTYSAAIIANSGYEITSIIVTMGGTNITESVVTGNIITISNVTGNIVITAVAEEVIVEIVNQIPLSTDTDGTIYNGIGYKTNTRIRSSGETEKYDGASCTGFIDVSVGNKIYIKGIVSNTSGLSKVHCYDITKNKSLGAIGFSSLTNEGNNVYSCTITIADTEYIRVASAHIMDGSEIVTINQPIV